ncbi:hypothetical protein DYB36_002995, partial [Aphanomyces astaci]
MWIIGFEVTYGQALAPPGYHRVTNAEGAAAEISPQTYLWYKLQAPDHDVLPPVRALLIHTHQVDGYDMVPKPIVRSTTTPAATSPADSTDVPAMYLLYSTFVDDDDAKVPLPIKELRIDNIPGSTTKHSTLIESNNTVPSSSLPAFEWVDVVQPPAASDDPNSTSEPLLTSIHAHLSHHRLCLKRATRADVDDFEATTAAVVAASSSPLSRYAVGTWVDVLDSTSAALSPRWRASQVKANTSVTPSRLLPPQALVLLLPQYRAPHKELVVLGAQVRAKVAPLGSHTNLTLSPAYPTLRATSMRRLLVPADIEAIHQTLDESFFDMHLVYFQSCLVPFVETCMASPCRDVDTALAMQAFLQNCLKHWVAAVLGDDDSMIPPPVYPYAVVALLKLLCNGYDVCSAFYQPDGHAAHWERLDDFEHTMYFDMAPAGQVVPRLAPCRSVYFVENIEYFLQAGGLRAMLRRVERETGASNERGVLVPLAELDMYLTLLGHAKPILTPTDSDVDGLTRLFHASFDRLNQVTPADLHQDLELVVESVLDRIDALISSSSSSWLHATSFDERLELTRINMAYQYVSCRSLSHQLTGIHQLVEWRAKAQALDDHLASHPSATTSTTKRVGSLQRLSSLITKTASTFVTTPISSSISSSSTPSRARWLTSGALARWLRRANVLELLLGDPTAAAGVTPAISGSVVRDAHVEVWKRSTPLLALLSQHGLLTETHLTLLWHLGRKHTTRRKIVYEMLLQLASSMNIPLLDAIARLLHDTIPLADYDGLTIHFLTRITRLANGKAHSARTKAAVEVATLTKVAALGVDMLWTATTQAPHHAMHQEFITAFATLLHEMHVIEATHHMHDGAPNTRERYIQLCVRALAAAPHQHERDIGVPVELALRVLQAIIEGYVRTQVDLSRVTSSVEASAIKNAIKVHPLHPFIDELVTTYQLVDVVVAVVRTGVAPTAPCLTFLGFLLTSSGLTLDKTHINALYRSLHTSRRMQMYFAWLTDVLPKCTETSQTVVVLPDKFFSNGAFTEDDVEAIFSHQFSTPSAMDAVEFDCFERLFRYVNGAIYRNLSDVHLPDDFSVNVPLPDLHGYDTLLAIATTCHVIAVADAVQQYLVYLLLHLSPATFSATSKQQHSRRDIWLQFAVWCMSHVYDAMSLAKTSVARRLLELLAMFLYHAQPTGWRGGGDDPQSGRVPDVAVVSNDLMVYIKMQDGRTSAPLNYSLPGTCLVGELRDRVAADVGHFADRIRLLTDTKVKLTVSQHDGLTLDDVSIFGTVTSSKKKKAYVEAIVLKKPELDTAGHKKSTKKAKLLRGDAAADWAAVATYLASTWVPSLLEMLEDPAVCDTVWRVLARLPRQPSSSSSVLSTSLPTLIFQMDPPSKVVAPDVAIHVREVLLHHTAALSSAKNLLVWHGWSLMFATLDRALQQGVDANPVPWPDNDAGVWDVVLCNVLDIAHVILSSQQVPTTFTASQTGATDGPTGTSSQRVVYSPAPLLDNPDSVCELALVHALSLVCQLLVVDRKSSLATTFRQHPHVQSVLVGTLDHASSQVRGEAAKTVQSVCNSTLNPSSWQVLVPSCVTLLGSYDGPVTHGDLFYLYGDIVAKQQQDKQLRSVHEQRQLAMGRLLARLQLVATTPDDEADHVLEGLLHSFLGWMEPPPPPSNKQEASNEVVSTHSEWITPALVVEVFDKCLFPPSTTTTLVKCRSRGSRSAAFQLLLQCVDVSPALALPIVLARMLPQHSFDRKPPKIDIKHSTSSSLSLSSKATSPKQPTKPRGPFVGLKNLGNTCYFNAVVQMGFMFPPFQRLVLSCESESSPVLFQLQSLYAHLRGSSRPYVNPLGLLSVLKTNTGAAVNVKMQQDASEFLTSFLQQLEAEINNGKQHDVEAAFARALGGVFSNELVADGNRYSERTEPFHYISVAVRDKNTLVESLDSWVEGDMVSYTWDDDDHGDKHAMDTHKRISIQTLPECLILHLKRFEFDFETMQQVKVHDRFEFPVELDMRRAHSGHYYAYLKDPHASSWYEFNDTVVTPFDPRHLAAECFGGVADPSGKHTPSMKTHSAFMLVYTRRKPTLALVGEQLSPPKKRSFGGTSVAIMAVLRFKRRQYVAEAACTTFTYDLCHKYSSHMETLGLTSLAFQVAATYVFGTLWQCRDVARLLAWRPLVLSMVGTNEASSLWWIYTLGTHPTLLVDVLVEHDQEPVRTFATDVTLRAMDMCADVARCEPMMTKLLTEFDHILECEHSFVDLLLAFARKGPEASACLVHRHHLVAKLVGMMVTGKNAQPVPPPGDEFLVRPPSGLQHAFHTPPLPPKVLIGDEHLWQLLALVLQH